MPHPEKGGRGVRTVRTVLLRLQGVRKVFPGVVALDDVDFDLQDGEVHALVGENGAGKSTLIKLIAGVYAPDAGIIEISGRPVRLNSPRDAQALGITVIYQETTLFPDLSVLENLYTGAYLRRGPFLDWRRMRRQAQETIRSLGLALDLDAQVRSLSVAQQQLVEIARAMLRDARVLIMDEPTAPLTHKDVQALFGLVRQLKARGVGMIYISHRLEEVFEVADRVTVLRDGHRVFTGPVSSVTREELIQHMVGRPLRTLFPKTLRPPGPPVLEVEGLGRDGALHDVSLVVREGEIVGLAGLVGSGRTTLAHALCGIAPPQCGRIRIRGQEVHIRSPAQAKAYGLAYVPEDRQRQGLVLPFSVRSNLSLVLLHQFTRFGVVDEAAEDRLAQRTVARLGIRAPSTITPAMNLSGGNQQKVVVGKWMITQPTVLIMDEPTRGVDVGAKAEIHRLMDELASRGIGILLISSELSELLGMCDRIYVMHRGRIVGELRREEATQERIIALATGVGDRIVGAVGGESG